MDLRYHVLRLGAIAVSCIPMKLGYLVAECCGDTLFLLSARHRNIVSNNINHALGSELDRVKLRQKVRGVFRNKVKNYFDLIKLSRLRLESYEERVTIEGWHHLKAAVLNGGGAIIASAHLGSLEYATQILALRGIKITALVEACNSTPFLRLITKLRQDNGIRVLPVSTGALRGSLQILRSGGTMGLICDRDIQGNGLKMKFFGEETSLPFGAVSLALRTGAAVVPIFGVRKYSNHFAIHIEPPIRLINTGNHRHSVRVNMEKLVAIMERYIRQYPEQWVMLDPIWNNHTGEVDPA